MQKGIRRCSLRPGAEGELKNVKLLMMAVLGRAITDFRGPGWVCTKHHNIRERIRADARRWLLSDENAEYLFSMAAICDVLALDVQAVRAKIFSAEPLNLDILV